MIAQKQLRKVMRGFSTILILILVAFLIIIIGILMQMVMVKNLNHDYLKSATTHKASDNAETLEEYLNRSAPQVNILYRQIEEIFKDDLPALSPKQISQSYKQDVRINIQISKDQLSIQRFKDEIIARFIDHQWRVNVKHQKYAYAHHNDYGYCVIYYPDQQYPEWLITCAKRQHSSLNQIPTKPE